MTKANRVTETLLRSREPAIRWRTRVLVMGQDPNSPVLRGLSQTVRRSSRVRHLLALPRTTGGSAAAGDPYRKWQGSHWALAAISDLGYPPGDRSLHGLRDQVLRRWLGPGYYKEFVATTESAAYRGSGVPQVRGRYRRCASQQGNALLSVTKLGIDDGRSAELVERLLHWQWPDGGWNCDRKPTADTSSFAETRHAMLGLAAFGRAHDDSRALAAARHASEVFLTRKLFRERHSGRIMNGEFVRLHYPLYYYYDILGGLKAMADIGRIDDPRCREALDLLETKELPSGGWAAEHRFYKVSSRFEPRADSVDWGGTSKHAMNEWVTTDALYVLRAAGRI
jgi:hypothetical protein